MAMETNTYSSNNMNTPIMPPNMNDFKRGFGEEIKDEFLLGDPR